MHRLVAAALIAATTTLYAQAQTAVADGPVGPSPYDVVRGWHKPFAEPGFAFGGNSGVFAESPDRIFVAQRGEFRLPNPVPPEFAGFAGSIGINVLTPPIAASGRTASTRSIATATSRSAGRSGITCARARPARARIGCASARTTRERRVWVVNETFHHDLRVLERRQQAAEDARREERAGQRRHALRQAAGRGVSAGRPDPRSPTASTTTA